MLKTITEIKDISKRVTVNQSKMGAHRISKMNEVRQKNALGEKSLSEKSEQFNKKYGHFF